MYWLEFVLRNTGKMQLRTRKNTATLLYEDQAQKWRNYVHGVSDSVNDTHWRKATVRNYLGTWSRTWTLLAFLGRCMKICGKWLWLRCRKTNFGYHLHPLFTFSHYCFLRFQTKRFQNYKALKEYKEEHGDALVPRGYKPNPALAHWVKRMRHAAKKFRDDPSSVPITAEQIKLLDDIGFCWENPLTKSWNQRWDELLRFKVKFASFFFFRRINKLLLFNFVHKVMFADWRQCVPILAFKLCCALVTMQEEHGHCNGKSNKCLNKVTLTVVKRSTSKLLTNPSCLCHFGLSPSLCVRVVPKNYPANPKLVQWCQNQRAMRNAFLAGKKTFITAERIQMLEDVGFEFSSKPSRAGVGLKRNTAHQEEDSDSEQEEESPHHSSDNHAAGNAYHANTAAAAGYHAPIQYRDPNYRDSNYHRYHYM